MKRLLIFCFVLILLSNLKAQDTLRLAQKPSIVLKSWYPEYKDFPTLKIREKKVLFAKTPYLQNTTLQDNHIELKAINAQVEIQETEKPNQYLITVWKADTTYVEFELWLDLKSTVVLLKQKSVWKNITQCYQYKDNKVMIQSVKLKVVN